MHEFRMEGNHPLQENQMEEFENPQLNHILSLIFNHRYKKALQICKNLLSYDKNPFTSKSFT